MFELESLRDLRRISFDTRRPSPYEIRRDTNLLRGHAILARPPFQSRLSCLRTRLEPLARFDSRTLDPFRNRRCTNPFRVWCCTISLRETLRHELRKTRAESRTSISRETDATTRSSCEDPAASRDPCEPHFAHATSVSRCDRMFLLQNLRCIAHAPNLELLSEPAFRAQNVRASRCGHEILSNPMMHAQTLVAPRSYEIPFETPRCTHEPVFQARARSRDSILFRGFWLRSSYAFYCVRTRCSHE